MRKLGAVFLRAIVLLQSLLDITGRANIEFAPWVLKHIDEIYIVLFTQSPRAGLEPAT